MNLTYFTELRSRINAQLEASSAEHRSLQIHRFPWLYGALGEVPSSVMFVCENPSLAGVERANRQTVDGQAPDIEAQWWGGSNNPAGKRFRVALYQTHLKLTPPAVKGGWRCYITNVIKEMNVAGEHRDTTTSHREMAKDWSAILRWELEQVRPRHVFTVGGAAHRLVKGLVAAGHLPAFSPVLVPHFTKRGFTEEIIADMVTAIRRELGD